MARRRRKPGESRMDAAVDAMKSFGFEEKLIKQTVRELLKVYGGNEAWVLIEDGCYNALLEVLLQKNGEDEEGNEKNESNNEEEGNQAEQTMALVQDPDTTPAGITEPPNDAEPPLSDITDTASGSNNTGMEESRRGDINLVATAINPDINLENTNINPDVYIENTSINPDVYLENTNIDLSPTIRPPQPPVTTTRNQRRKPCYGWISDDHEENDSIVYGPSRTPPKRRRKSGWDVRPDDL